MVWLVPVKLFAPVRCWASRWFVLVATILAMVCGGAAEAGATQPRSAAATTAKARSPVTLTVSWPSPNKPLRAVPGGVAAGEFWVTNPTRSPIGVQVLAAGVSAQDNGSLRFSSRPSPWLRVLSIYPAAFVASPGSTTTVTVRVVMGDVPTGVYLAGFVVRPEISSRDITVVNEIGAIVTFEIPGPEYPRLRVRLVVPGRALPFGLATLQIADYGQVTLRVLDDSPSSGFAYEAFGLSGRPGRPVVIGEANPAVEQAAGEIREPVALYFPWRYRDVALHWRPAVFGVGTATVRGIAYDHITPTTLTSVGASATVLVVSPWWPLGIAAVVAAVALEELLAAWRRWRSNQARPGRRPSVTSNALPSTAVRVVGWALALVIGAFASVAGDAVIVAGGLVVFVLVSLLVSGAMSGARRRGEHDGRDWGQRLFVLQGLAAAFAVTAVSGEALALHGPGQALALGLLGATVLSLGFLGVLRSAV